MSPQITGDLRVKLCTNVTLSGAITHQVTGGRDSKAGTTVGLQPTAVTALAGQGETMTRGFPLATSTGLNPQQSRPSCTAKV